MKSIIVISFIDNRWVFGSRDQGNSIRVKLPDGVEDVDSQTYTCFAACQLRKFRLTGTREVPLMIIYSDGEPVVKHLTAVQGL